MLFLGFFLLVIVGVTTLSEAPVGERGGLAVEESLPTFFLTGELLSMLKLRPPSALVSRSP